MAQNIEMEDVNNTSPEEIDKKQKLRAIFDSVCILFKNKQLGTRTKTKYFPSVGHESFFIHSEK